MDVTAKLKILTPILQSALTSRLTSDVGVGEKACLDSGSSFPEDQESSFASGTSCEDVALDQDLLAGSPSALDGTQMESWCLQQPHLPSGFLPPYQGLHFCLSLMSL